MALELSRTYAKELVTEGYVTIDGRPVGKAATKLSGAEVVSVILPPPRPMHVEAEQLDLDIIYQDPDMAAINKPPGMVAHPTATLRTGTVYLHRFAQGKRFFVLQQAPAHGFTRQGTGHKHRLALPTPHTAAFVVNAVQANIAFRQPCAVGGHGFPRRPAA